MSNFVSSISKRQVRLGFGLISATVLAGALYLFKNRKQDRLSEVLVKPVDVPQNRYLTQPMAEQRAQQIVKHSLKYVVHLLLRKGAEYEAMVQLCFRASHLNTDLFMDYRGKELLGLVINGTNVPQPKWNGLFITIPKELLKNDNEVRLRIKNNYSSDGCGLHGFTDADGKQYLYSQGESYFCNRFFPCMDQPDLKATLQFKIVAPQEWTVISNESPVINDRLNLAVLRNESKGQEQQWVQELFSGLREEDFKLWVYGTTPLLPSYLFCVIAGEYWSIKNQNEGIPQTIYCRESLKEHMMKLKDFIFEVTHESMLFYEKYFGVPYQFSKYDSVFCAEYNWGAMENPGCVTFNDLYVFKEQKEATRYTQLANTIAHEMAHHWFGNYVTMRWWNDLWLNESYADFISHFCLEHLNIKSIKLTSIGVMFNQRKGWGYREDQMVTTHPIAGAVPNTEVAENVFDGITYSKGASTMKQLMYLIGSEGFGRACGVHFKKFAWDNATLDDLIESLDVEFKKQNHPFSLQEWQMEWIQKAGLNEVHPEWDHSNLNQNATLTIHQGVALPEFPTLRRHKMKIAFFTASGDVVEQEILVNNQAQTKINYDGSRGYKAILLNYGDYSFIKVLLDDVSADYFRQNLHNIKDTLTRQIIWRAFFDTARDGKISSEEYTDVIIENAPREVSDEILNTQLLYLASAVHNMTPNKFQKTLSSRTFDFLVNMLQHISLDKDLQNRIVMLRDSLFSFTSNDSDIETLVKWYNREFEPLKHVEMSLSNKWSLVRLVHSSKRFDNQLRSELFGQCEALDKSDQLLKMKKVCEALLADHNRRKQIWASFMDLDNKESVKLMAYTMSGFNDSRRLEELQNYQDLFFDSLIEISEKRSTDFVKEFYHSLFPQTDDLAYLNKKLNETLNRLPQNQVTLQINIKKSLDDITKRVRQFECFGKRAKLAQIHN